MHALIIRPGALGDTLMLLPALDAMKGHCRITFLGRQPGVDYIRGRVHRALDLEQGGWHRLFAESWDQGPLPVRGAHRVVAFLKDPEGQVRKNLHTHFPDALIRLFPSLPLREEGTHVARYAAHCLAEAGLPVDPAEAVARALKIGLLQEEGGRPRSRDLFFHPGSGDPAKNYTPAFWFELIKRLRTERMMSSMRLSMLLGPAERDTAEFFSEGAEALGIRLFTCPSRAQVLEFLGEAALYLGHDSGITHVAAMIGTPTVALFRKSDVSLWRPLGPCVVTLSHPGPETPAFLDQVIESIRDLLEASEAFACHHQTNPL